MKPKESAELVSYKRGVRSQQTTPYAELQIFLGTHVVLMLKTMGSAGAEATPCTSGFLQYVQKQGL